MRNVSTGQPVKARSPIAERDTRPALWAASRMRRLTNTKRRREDDEREAPCRMRKDPWIACVTQVACVQLGRQPFLGGSRASSRQPTRTLAPPAGRRSTVAVRKKMFVRPAIRVAPTLLRGAAAQPGARTDLIMDLRLMCVDLVRSWRPRDPPHWHGDGGGCPYALRRRSVSACTHFVREQLLRRASGTARSTGARSAVRHALTTRRQTCTACLHRPEFFFLCFFVRISARRVAARAGPGRRSRTVRPC